MVPTVEFPPVFPLTSQDTALLLEPVTEAVNFAVSPTFTRALAGVTLTEMGDFGELPLHPVSNNKKLILTSISWQSANTGCEGAPIRCRKSEFRSLTDRRASFRFHHALVGFFILCLSSTLSSLHPGFVRNNRLPPAHKGQSHNRCKQGGELCAFVNVCKCA
jgi:hypothetical protein